MCSNGKTHLMTTIIREAMDHIFSEKNDSAKMIVRCFGNAEPECVVDLLKGPDDLAEVEISFKNGRQMFSTALDEREITDKAVIPRV